MASVHERIVTVIRDTAITVNPAGRFIYGRELFSSFDYGNNSTPNSDEPNTLISLLPFTITKNTNADTVFDSASLLMVFSRSADVVDDPTREEAIINEMAAVAETVINLLDFSSKPITFTIGNVQLEPNYHHWMGTNTGYIASFTINMKQECELPSIQGLQNNLQSLLQS